MWKEILFKKKILIVSALSSELKVIKEKVKSLKIKKLEIKFFESWMWNYKTILNLTEFLTNQDFDFIVNIWVCWYKKEIEKCIQVGRIKNLANNKELIVPIFFEFSKIKSIASSEKIIYDKKEIFEEDFVDMESYWFELVAEKFELPRIILKIPVDMIWEETKNFDFLKAKNFLKENIDYEKLFEKIFLYLPSPQPSPLWGEGVKQKLNLTESQKIIFEQLYNKYSVLVWDNFEKYLENFFKNFLNKKLEKNDIKKFLKDLEEFLDDK